MAISLSQLPAHLQAQVRKQLKATARPRVAATPATGRALEQRLADALGMAGLTGFVTQHLAVKAKRRRYAWDFAYLPQRLLIEVQGGTWSQTRMGHSTGTGIRRDCQKHNAATLEGWRVLVFTSDMIRDGQAVETIRKALQGER